MLLLSIVNLLPRALLSFNCFFRLAFLAWVPLLLTGTAAAQSTTAGAIGGTVSDSQNRVIPGAQIKVRALSTAIERGTATDPAGSFRLAELTPGVYSLEISASGFSNWTSASVVVEVGRLTEIVMIRLLWPPLA
jgi:hypothetical protein